jgi:hypothetical protein
MSRILRRPMFRGGRVDSRGTGITSGLSYKKGGRVGYDNGGGVFPVGGNMYRFLESPIGSSLAYGIPGALGDMVYTPINQLGRLFGFNPGLSSRRGIRQQKDFLFGTDRPGRMTDEEIQTTNFLGIPFSAQSFTEARQAEEKAAADKIQKEKANQLALDLEKARLEKNKQEDTEETVDIAEDIKSNKELFAELLGSKKARGQDISDMLLSFAGKALAPGADVKSALGEFAAEEAKRPSRASKIDESAAALAINDYIAGRKTAKALADQLTLFDKKLERQQSAGAITGKDFQTALTIVQDRYKGQYKRNSDTVVSETLKGLFEKPVFSVSGELDKIKAEDIKEGFTILTTKDGKYIIEKIGDSLKIRSDLLI